MRAYKLLRMRKDGSLGSLFINKAYMIPMGVWLRAGAYKTKGYAYRPGWHCLFNPSAPHLTMKNRVWVRVEINGTKEFTRPAAQGGNWLLAQTMKVLEVLE